MSRSPSAVAFRSAGTTDASPVVRAQAGNLGLFFRFGGLANLTASGNGRTVGGGTSSSAGVLLTQVGVKIVASEAWQFPIYFGTGLRLVNVSSGTPLASNDHSNTDWGLDLGGGFEYHFRIWRRISPFLGLGLGVGISDPSGDSNTAFGVGLGPSLGVEYYIGDRVSLSALYQFVVQVAYQKVSTGSSITSVSSSLTQFAFQTLAGGAMNLTYYF
jgi:hypothetical protein